MAFKKGTSGNASGRPKGAKGKLPTTVRDFIKELIDANRDKINRDINALEPKERLDIMVKLFGFVVPKPQSVVIQDISPTDGNLSRLADIDNAPDDIREGYFNYIDWTIKNADAGHMAAAAILTDDNETDD